MNLEHASTAEQLEAFEQLIQCNGLTDMFAMRTRPNPVLAPAEVYETKTRRWRQEWPQLTVLPWART